MCIKEIVFYPDQILRSAAKTVSDVLDSKAQEVIAALKKTMDAYEHCVGLAANQIGSDLDIFVADASKNKRTKSEHGFIVMVNPKITERIDQVKMREGCMSVPDLTGDVLRYRQVTMVGLNEFGEERTTRASDFEARVFQHEIDHLAGKVFLDRVRSARDVYTRKSYR